MRGGALDSAPLAARSSLGIGADGTLTVARVAFDGTWRGNGQRRQLDLNAAPAKGHTTLYTSAWGPETPAESGVVVDVIAGAAAARRRTASLTGVVTQVATGGPVPIPPGGAVLVARGNQAPHLNGGGARRHDRRAPPDADARLERDDRRDRRRPAARRWRQARVPRATSPSAIRCSTARTARSAVGQLSDGRILLVTVEGGGSAYSAGMTNYELAVALVRLGARTAMGLGTGTSAAMAFDGSLLTRPRREQPVADALVLSYSGVYVAPPVSTSSRRTATASTTRRRSRTSSCARRR